MAYEPTAYLWVLVGSIVVEDDWSALSAGTWRSTALRKRMNS